MPRPRILGPWLLALGLAACDAPLDPVALELRDGPIEIEEGTWPPPGGIINTAWLGEMALMRLLPPSIFASPRDGDGVVLLIEVLDGGQYVPVTGVAAPEGSLILTTAGGTYEGDELLGSRWWLDEARTEHVEITGVSEVGPAFGYQLDHHFAGAEQPVPVCRPGAAGERWAYLVEDVHVEVEDGAITREEGPVLVACASGALGKSITWGFSPWLEGDIDMALYRTGVRTVMADYCGDGSSHTEDGTLIQVDSELAGRSFFAPEASTEAIFGPDGALCLSELRAPQRRRECTLSPCDESFTLGRFHAWTKLVPAPL